MSHPTSAQPARLRGSTDQEAKQPILIAVVGNELRPYGKAEALIKTLLREWAYRFAHPSSQQRARALPGFVRWYNRRRPHGSLGGRPPRSRVADLCGQYT